MLQRKRTVTSDEGCMLDWMSTRTPCRWLWRGGSPSRGSCGWRMSGRAESSESDCALRAGSDAAVRRRCSFCVRGGVCGFALQRQLSKLGFDCLVAAPTLIPRRSSDRVKTDRRDARELARLSLTGLLTPIWIPSLAQKPQRGRDRRHRNLLRLSEEDTKRSFEISALARQFLYADLRMAPPKRLLTPLAAKIPGKPYFLSNTSSRLFVDPLQAFPPSHAGTTETVTSGSLKQWLNHVKPPKTACNAAPTLALRVHGFNSCCREPPRSLLCARSIS